jgi:hypothetical protein
MLQMLILYVVDVGCGHVMLGVMSREEGRPSDVGCCTQHRSQHESLEHCAREEGGGHDVGCCTQHARNMAQNITREHFFML